MKISLKNMIENVKDKIKPADDTVYDDGSKLSHNHDCKKSVKYVNQDQCTGCASCYNSCPADAITMQMNCDGFWQPHVDGKRCTNCGICVKKCPIDNLVLDKFEEPECYALYADNDKLRKQSSSGGFFGILADFARDLDAHVCGAAFTDGLNLELVIIGPNDDISPLQGSKYLQSQVGKIYTDIKALLQNDKWVLFTGTPCQVAGLNRFLDKAYEKLITAEVMCHGGASPGAFAKYIKERFPQENIKNYYFRSKELLDCGYSEIAQTYDGHTIIRIKGPSDYLRLFNSCITVRKSCGICQSARLPRQADFTMADAWGISQINNSINDGHGVSLISVNSEKAKKIFSGLLDKMRKCDRVPLDWVLTHGQPMGKAFRPTPFQHERFFPLMRHNSFHRAYDYTLQGKFDVAIMGVWYGGNYGSIMTYYSLYSYLGSLGLLVLMIDKPIIVQNDLEHNPNYHPRKFARKHYGSNISNARPPERMWELNRYADTFILGSDQVLHNNSISYFKNTVLLNFVDDIKKKIAFSSSFGHESDSNPREKRAEIGRLLRRFDYIGLREESGLRILRDNYGIYDGTTVMDAIFLNDAYFYKTLACESKVVEKEQFIAAYILDPNQEIGDMLNYLSEKLDIKIILLLDGATYKFAQNQQKISLPAEKDIEVQDWLYYMSKADYIVTDSYHGACFSILFNKNFITLANRKRGLARFDMLFGATGLTNRIIFEPNEQVCLNILRDNIDYQKVNSILNKRVFDSKEWLKDALFAEKAIENPAKYKLKVIETYEKPLSEKFYVKLETESNHLQFKTNIIDYLTLLNEKKESYIIFIAVKDTPGNEINDRISELLNTLGVKSDLRDKLWHSFIAIIDGGLNIMEKIENNIPITCKTTINGKNIIIDSAPFKNGNTANIIIENTNYSLNKRGLNFVIMEKKANKIIDTVSFDTHNPSIPCYRVV